MKRILLFGDNLGVPELLARIEKQRIAAVVASAIRPNYHALMHATTEEHGVPMLVQPGFRDAAAYADFVREVAALEPDGLICHSYAMLVRADILALVEGRAFNVHFSLLPRHRGPNPVQWALVHGDSHTGVSLHIMGEGFDTGDIVAQESLEIAQDDTWPSLMRRLHAASNQLLDNTLPNLIAGTWRAEPQDDAIAIKNPRITPQSFEIDFSSMNDRQIFDLIRAQVAPLPGAFVKNGRRVVRFPDFVPLSRIAELRRRYEN